MAAVEGEEGRVITDKVLQQCFGSGFKCSLEVYFSEPKVGASNVWSRQNHTYPAQILYYSCISHYGLQ